MAPLHDAAREGDVESIQLILDASSNPDALMDQPEARLGWTALHCAVIRGRVEAVQLLVERGAWVDKANLNQLTPLMSAVQQHRRYEIIHALVVDGGANVLQRNHNNTPLLEIAEKAKCDDRVMSLLREHAARQQAEVDAKKEEAKRKRAEAAAKRKAEREANGGVAPKKKKGRKGATAKKKNPPPKPKEEIEEPKESAAEDSKNDDAATKEGEEKDDETGPNGQAEPNEQQSKTTEEKTNEKTQEQSTNKAPFPFLQADNQEVIGAVKLMVVQNGTTVVREESVDLYAESGSNDDNQQEEEVTVRKKVLEAATKLTKQMEAWNPDQPAFAFFIPPPEVEAGQETLQAAMESNASFQEKPHAGALLAHGLLQVKDDGNQMEVRIKNIAHARKTAWTNRYYYNFGRVDSKRLAKIKAATNALKAQTVKDTICEVKFYTEDRAWYWPTVLLVGECKKVPGALFGIKFDCIEQEHHHHGN